MPYTLLVHNDVDQLLQSQSHDHPDSIADKTRWALLQLALYGRTPKFKGTEGHMYPWRRTPVRGNDFYLWWIRESNGHKESPESSGTIRVRRVRPHDDTALPLDLGQDSAYRRIQAANLDVRFSDQKELAVSLGEETGVDVRVIVGHPGSGKTVALQYAADELVWRREADADRVLYVTYAKALATQAQDFFSARGIGERVLVHTFSSLADSMVGRGDVNETQFADRHAKAIEQFLEHRKTTKSAAKEWKSHEDMLWTELRAHILGMALPFDWSRGNGIRIPAGSVLELKPYLDLRRPYLSGAALTQAHRLAKELTDRNRGRFFPEEVGTRASLERLSGPPSESDSEFDHLVGIIVDEIQDLTLLQFALLVELAKRGSKTHSGFAMLVAGDESQTVQPSGFDWGIYKDFVTSHVGSKPRTCNLPSQRRSPARLGRLIKDSWNLYTRYAGGLMPDRKHTDEEEGVSDSGGLMRWRLDSAIDWNTVLTELNSYADVALVDLGKRDTFGWLGERPKRIAKRIRFTPPEIKGLERSTLFVLGLDQVARDLETLNKRAAQQDKSVEAHVCRGLVDAIRISLSRSTQTLVLVEPEKGLPPSMVQALSIDDITPVYWGDVSIYLQKHSGESDDSERITEFLSNADWSLDRGDPRRALLNNQEASNLLQYVDDLYLSSQVKQQREKIDAVLTRLSLADARNCLDKGDFPEAQRLFEAMRDDLNRSDDADLKREAAALFGVLEVNNELERIDRLLEAGHVLTAYDGYKRADFGKRLESSANRPLKDKARDVEARVTIRLTKLAEEFWQEALEQRKVGDYVGVSKSMRDAVRALQRLEGQVRAGELNSMIEIYQLVPLGGDMRDSRKVLEKIESHLDLVGGSAEQSPQSKLGRLIDGSRIAFLSDFMVETCRVLAENPAIFSDVGSQISRILGHREMAPVWSESTIQSRIKQLFLSDNQSLKSAMQPHLAFEIADMFGNFDTALSQELKKPYRKIDRVLDTIKRDFSLADRKVLLEEIKRQFESSSDATPGAKKP